MKSKFKKLGKSTLLERLHIEKKGTMFYNLMKNKVSILCNFIFWDFISEKGSYA